MTEASWKALFDEAQADAIRIRQERDALQRRCDELLVANNQEVARRRGFEEEANQAETEKFLLRNECTRLRGVIVRL